MEQATKIMMQNSEVFGGEIIEENLNFSEREAVLNISDTQNDIDSNIDKTK